jgi:hypothetical protein
MVGFLAGEFQRPQVPLEVPVRAFAGPPSRYPRAVGDPAGRDDQRLEAVPWGELPVSRQCPGLRGRAGVAVHHAPALPARQPHEVGLAAASSRPLMSKRMPEHVGVNLVDSGLPRAPPEHLPNSRGRHSALFAQPQPGEYGLGVLPALAKVAI